MNRIAVIDKSKCKPTKCNKECMRYCPPQLQGKNVISIVDIEDIAIKGKIANIAENLCIGCNACVKRCPFNAIKIVNVPSEIPDKIVHQYGPNEFRLHQIPIIKQGVILGIIGENGIGKSTLINILTGQIKLDKSILKQYKGTTMQNYFSNLYSRRLICSVKPQQLAFSIQDSNGQITEFRNTLSGGELQKELCLHTASKSADVYIFDEPSNYLDIHERIEISKIIISLKNHNKYVMVIDHDLSMLDFIADEISIGFGVAGAYGVMSSSITVAEGINQYLNGYITSMNLRFRETEFSFKTSSSNSSFDVDEEKIKLIAYDGDVINYEYDDGRPNFNLIIPPNAFRPRTLTLILGKNGTGKTTFIRTISNKIVGENGVYVKPQYISPNNYIKENGEYPKVIELFYERIRNSYVSPEFQSEVIRPLKMKKIENRRVNELSGGELQLLEMVLCLGTPRFVYFIDEPSANLDIEKRLILTGILRKFICKNKHSCVYIVEHDISMSVSIAQFTPSQILMIENGIVSDYMNFNDGIQHFLETLNVTMRLSVETNRPRINKLGSRLDTEQKLSGMYYPI